MIVIYEVNVGSGSTNGAVYVADNATDDDIRLAIMDDLYFVGYDTVKINQGDQDNE